MTTTETLTLCWRQNMKFEDRLEELAAQATPVPWQHRGRRGLDLNHEIVMPDGRRVMVGDAIYHDGGDAALIVAQRNALPQIVAVLRAARAQHELDCVCLVQGDDLCPVGDALAELDGEE